MNRKLNYMNLADEFVARLHLSQSETETFLRAFFDTIEQGLAADQQVKVKGLGTFKLNEMGARGSIDVNTGERITIQGYNKITFTPEATLKDRINKPFAHFETTELADDYEATAQELDQEPEPAQEPTPEPTQEPSLEQNCPLAETAPAVPVVEEAIPAAPMAEEEAPAAPVIEATVQAAPVAPATEEAIPVAPVAPVEEEEAPAIPAAEAAATEEAPTTEEPVAPVPAGESASPAPVAFMNTPAAPENQETPATLTPEAVSTTPAEDNDESTEAPSSEQKSPENPASAASAPKARRKAWRYWLPIVLFILLACGLYIYTLAGGKTRSPRSPRQDANAIKVETIDFDDDPAALSAATDTVCAPVAAAPIDTLTAPKAAIVPETATEAQAATATPTSQAAIASAGSPVGSSTAATAAPTATAPEKATTPVSTKAVGTALPIVPALAARNIKDITSVDTCDYTIAGTLTSHELQDGETIVRLALRYYGDKRLWPYIVKYNWMKDYDNVHPGTIVNIPNLKVKE